MSYNIRYANPADGKHAWDQRKALVASQIRYYKPDLIGFQEVLKTQLDDLESMLSDYAYVGVGRDDGVEKGEFAPIFFKKDKFLLLDWGTVWLSPSPDVPSLGWDAALPRIFTWVKVKDKKTAEAFYMANAHFDHRGVVAQEKSAELLYTQSLELAGDLPMFLTGDFNFNQKAGGYTYLSQQSRIADSYKVAQFRHGPEGTFNGFTYEMEGDRIDYIWTDTRWEVLSYAALSELWEGILPSDHIPVLIRVRKP
jgi:endonuclease/exonuclease/phosphatase family metal-dependent hydrolase